MFDGVIAINPGAACLEFIDIPTGCIPVGKQGRKPLGAIGDGYRQASSDGRPTPGGGGVQGVVRSRCRRYHVLPVNRQAAVWVHIRPFQCVSLPRSDDNFLVKGKQDFRRGAEPARVGIDGHPVYYVVTVGGTVILDYRSIESSGGGLI